MHGVGAQVNDQSEKVTVPGCTGAVSDAGLAAARAAAVSRSIVRTVGTTQANLHTPSIRIA